MPNDVLVIGYGNGLRQDDGLGPHVAAALAARRLPGVRVLALHQLLPELAVDLAEARLAVFVDARHAGAALAVAITPLEPEGVGDLLTHAGDPRGLLALARAAYGRSPEAWWVTVAGEAFGFGEGLSPAAAANAREAQARIEVLLGGRSSACEPPPPAAWSVAAGRDMLQRTHHPEKGARAGRGP